jgi:hydrogenase nickel incorporation protein HypA/HybF
VHELTLCRGLLQQVTTIAEEHQASAIKSIHLKVGPLAGIEIELLKRSFPLVAHGTPAQEALLEITPAKATIHCDKCDVTSELDNIQLICPHCQSTATTLLSGDEMTLENVVLEQQEIKATHHVH